MRTRLLFTAWLLLTATASAQAVLEIPLSNASLPDTGLFYGSKVLTFTKVSTPPEGLPSGAHDAELASIVDHPAFERVWLIRYRATAGDTMFAVMPLKGTETTRPILLRFRNVGDRSVADVKIDMRPKGETGAAAQSVACQVVLSKGKVASRQAECREGTVKLGKHDYKIRVYANSVNDPYYVLSTDAVCLVDADRDGKFSPSWRLDGPEGKVVPAERIAPMAPFVLAGKRWTVSQLDSMGTKIKLQEFVGDTYAATGFKAPDANFRDLEGATHSLKALQGKVVLLTFWATTCGYCEKIRPQLNDMVGLCSKSPFVAVDVAVESDIQQLRTFLQATPYEGMIVPFSSSLWQTYNRRRTTPVFVLIDPQGTIQLAGSGASLFAVVEKMTRDMLQLP